MRRVSSVLVSILVSSALAWAVAAARASPGNDAGAARGGSDAPVEPDAGADAPAGADAVRRRAGRRVPLEHVTSVFPARDATGVCTDAPLRLFFDTPPMTGAGGWVQVFDAANPTTPVDSFDIAAPLTFQSIGGRNYFYKPIIISGNEAYIYLRKVLQPGATYYVTIDPGVFTDGLQRPADRRDRGFDHLAVHGPERGAARGQPARSRSPPTARAPSAPCRARSTTCRRATRRR